MFHITVEPGLDEQAGGEERVADARELNAGVARKVDPEARQVVRLPP